MNPLCLSCSGFFSGWLVLAVLSVLFCLSYPDSPVLAALSLSWQFSPNCPVLMVLSWQSCFAVLFCLSCSASNVLPVMFRLSCSGCLVPPFSFCLSCFACPFLPSHFAYPVLGWPFLASCPDCPLPTSCLHCLSWQPCPGSLVLAVLFWPSCSGRSVLAVQSGQSFRGSPLQKRAKREKKQQGAKSAIITTTGPETESAFLLYFPN